MASILRVQVTNSSGPFPSDCNQVEQFGAIKFQFGDDATMYHSGIENMTAWHDSCLISFVDYV
jgi:hypothetical protein